MTGAGAFAAGAGPAGQDPQAPTSTPNVAPLPAAIFFDPATKNYPMNADGSFVSVHPVDAIVTQRWTTTKGAIPAAPQVGRDLSLVKGLGDPQLQTKVFNALQSAVEDLRAAGDIVFKGGFANAPEAARGRLEVIGLYQNLRTRGAVRTR
jgi:hypothetical protein